MWCGSTPESDNLIYAEYFLRNLENRFLDSQNRTKTFGDTFSFTEDGHYCKSQDQTRDHLTQHFGPSGLDPACHGPITIGFEIDVVVKRAPANSTFCPVPMHDWMWPGTQDLWDECVKKLMPIVDGCDTTTTDQKSGGMIRLRQTEGCFDVGIFSTEADPLQQGQGDNFPEGKPGLGNMIALGPRDWYEKYRNGVIG
jgi:hypothetical protein